MDFTREPIIETVVTPKEGCKLVVRSSKSVGQEEYFVDAVQVVSFGNSIFFRSLERPKAFLVPASDYEILEVREARIVLKNVGMDRSIKIGGGREGNIRSGKEVGEEKGEAAAIPEAAPAEGEVAAGKAVDSRTERRRDRRRQYRRRRGREDGAPGGDEVSTLEKTEGGEIKIDLIPPQPILNISEKEKVEAEAIANTLLSDLLTPPPSLISETIARYKDNALFKGVFISKEEEEASKLIEELVSESAELPLPIEQPAFGSFEMSEAEEEEIYKQRKRRFGFETDREQREQEEISMPPEEEPSDLPPSEDAPK